MAALIVVSPHQETMRGAGLIPVFPRQVSPGVVSPYPGAHARVKLEDPLCQAGSGSPRNLSFFWPLLLVIVVFIPDYPG